MAEYYPLLARAVASIPNSTAEARRAVYERARKALLGQLQATEPPVPKADIARESQALDSAIARIEAEMAASARQVEAMAPPRQIGPAPAPPPPFLPTPPPAFRPAPPRPQAPGAPTGETVWPPSRADAPAQPAQNLQSPSLADPELPLPKAEAEQPANSTRDPYWSRFGRPREKPQTPRRTAPAAVVVNAAGVEALVAAPAVEPLRPAAPTPVESTRNRGWMIALACVVLVMVAGVGQLAWRWRDDPVELLRQRSQPVPETADAGAPNKIIERIGGGQRAPESPVAPAPRRGDVQGPAPAAPETSGSEPVLAVGQRAALLLEAPEEPQRVKTYFGSVVWKLETGASSPLPVLRAEVSLDDAKLKVTMQISRNADATAITSHVITLRFAPEAGAEFGAVSEIETPSLRIEDRPVGEALEGKAAAVTTNYFIVGLIRDEAMTARNLDLLRTRPWIDVPMRLSSGKIAKVTFEKGAQGERLLAEALAAWQR